MNPYIFADYYVIKSNATPSSKSCINTYRQPWFKCWHLGITWKLKVNIERESTNIRSLEWKKSGDSQLTLITQTFSTFYSKLWHEVESREKNHLTDHFLWTRISIWWQIRGDLPGPWRKAQEAVIPLLAITASERKSSPLPLSKNRLPPTSPVISINYSTEFTSIRRIQINYHTSHSKRFPKPQFFEKMKYNRSKLKYLKGHLQWRTTKAL